MQGAGVRRLERVGVGDNFFELGGSSLLAAQGVSRVCQLLSVELPLREFFAMPPIARVAVHRGAARRSPPGACC